MWDRWQAGDSLHAIARLFDRRHTSVRGVFERYGGIRPPIRWRSPRSLTLAEREEVSRGIAAGRFLRSIALRLGRAPSTVSRELRRNGGRHGYRASRADEAAWDRARRPKTCKLARHRALARMVAARLKLQWSPEEIAGWLRRRYPDDENRQVSHETIYKTLFIQARGALKKVRVKSKHTETVIDALIEQARKLPRELYKSLTWYRGKEMADHQRFSLATDIKVYFCDPQRPWQRGSNEQINGLLRQYFPKGMDLSAVHQNRLNAVARRLKALVGPGIDAIGAEAE